MFQSLHKRYSIKELEEAKISLSEAKKYDIPIDSRRNSVYPSNVKYLKDMAENDKERDSDLNRTT